MGNKKDNRKFEYGCVMAKADVPMWDEILSYIDEDDLYDDGSGSFGLEDEPHVTILFGLKELIPDSYIEKAISKIRPFHISLTSVSIFENPDYDVLKYDVESEYLRRLNTGFNKFPNENSYPEYHPHLTIAYLKKEAYKKYTMPFYFLPVKEIYCDTIIYSKVTGERKFYDISSNQ